MSIEQDLTDKELNRRIERMERRLEEREHKIHAAQVVADTKRQEAHIKRQAQATATRLKGANAMAQWLMDIKREDLV